MLKVIYVIVPLRYPSGFDIPNNDSVALAFSRMYLLKVPHPQHASVSLRSWNKVKWLKSASLGIMEHKHLHKLSSYKTARCQTKDTKKNSQWWAIAHFLRYSYRGLLWHAIEWCLKEEQWSHKSQRWCFPHFVHPNPAGILESEL